MDILEKLTRRTCGELSCDECNAERNAASAEIARLRESLRLAIRVRGTSEDTVEVLSVMESALLPNVAVSHAPAISRKPKP